MVEEIDCHLPGIFQGGVSELRIPLLTMRSELASCISSGDDNIILNCFKNPSSSWSEYDVSRLHEALMKSGAMSELTKFSSKRDVESLIIGSSVINYDSGAEVSIAIKGTNLSMCYLIVSGYLTSTCGNGINSVHNCGSVVGLEALQDIYYWEYELSTSSTSNVLLWCFPVEILCRYVGKHTIQTEANIIEFWNYLRVSAEAKCPSKLDYLNIKSLLPHYNSFIENLHPDPSIDVIGSARTRVYYRGTAIFTQGSDREYLHLVLSGETSLFRSVVINNKLINVNTGIYLYKGDFVMFDGEKDLEWLKNIQQSTPTSHKKFGVHQYTLYASSRVEICQIPLIEIEKCPTLIRKVHEKSISLHPKLLLNEDQLAKLYLDKKSWDVEKAKVINDIIADKMHRKLRQEFHVSQSNNLGDEAYSSKKPSVVSNLQDYIKYSPRLNKIVQKNTKSSEDSIKANDISLPTTVITNEIKVATCATDKKAIEAPTLSRILLNRISMFSTTTTLQESEVTIDKDRGFDSACLKTPIKPSAPPPCDSSSKISTLRKSRRLSNQNNAH